MAYIKRLLKKPSHSFFLFGPRGVGKSTWLKTHFKEALFINLLEQDTYLKFLNNPSYLRELTAPLKSNSWVCIDEIQKIPNLLDEVHLLIEDRKLKFALSGSSARKLKRGGANLLAGRAINCYLSSFSYKELSTKYNLKERLEFGNLPLILKANTKLKKSILKSYVMTYLKEEIQEESLVRKIQPFSRFLEVAAILNGQQVNKTNIAKEAQVSRPNIESYFSILEDTLIGSFLPAFTPQIKVREQNHPKFYWFDTGVARAVAGLLNETVTQDWLGYALETLILNELKIYNQINDKDKKIYFYRTQSGLEIDFVIELKKATKSQKSQVILIEVKNSNKWDSRWSKPMLSFKDNKKVEVKKMIGIYQGKDHIKQNNVDIKPVIQFLEDLHSGKIF